MTGSSYFEWNVDRVIVDLMGPFSLRWYSLFFLSGILIGNFIFHHMLVKEGKPTKLRDTLLYYIIIGTIVGARLGHCLFYDPTYYFTAPLRIFKIWEGGLASHGGFTGVIIAIFLFSRRYKDMPFFWLADRIAIVAILAGAFIRIGNFFNSEIIGKVTDVPWAIMFSGVDNLPRHPSQLYEALGYFTISLFLYLLYLRADRRPEQGRIFGLAMTIAFLFRFLIEGLKENQVSYEQDLLFNMGQLLSLPFVAIGILFALGLHRKVAWLQWGLVADEEAKPGPGIKADQGRRPHRGDKKKKA